MPCLIRDPLLGFHVTAVISVCDHLRHRGGHPGILAILQRLSHSFAVHEVWVASHGKWYCAGSAHGGARRRGPEQAGGRAGCCSGCSVSITRTAGELFAVLGGPLSARKCQTTVDSANTLDPHFRRLYGVTFADMQPLVWPPAATGRDAGAAAGAQQAAGGAGGGGGAAAAGGRGAAQGVQHRAAGRAQGPPGEQERKRVISCMLLQTCALRGAGGVRRPAIANSLQCSCHAAAAAAAFQNGNATDCRSSEMKPCAAGGSGSLPSGDSSAPVC